MRIALNLIFVSPAVAGGRIYSEGLLRGLAAVDEQNEYHVFTRCDTNLPGLPADRFVQVRAPISAASLAWRTFYEYTILPRKVEAGKFDLMHGLGTLSPTAGRRPLVLTIHDLYYRQVPKTVPLGYRLFASGVLPHVARRAARIVVPSRWTAAAVRRLLRVPEKRIRIIPNGPGQIVKAEPGKPADPAPVLERYGIRPPFVLSVSQIHPHKNVAGLLRAFALARRRGHEEAQLVLVGKRVAEGHALDQLVQELGLTASVRFTGHLTEADLGVVFRAAEVFAFPSLAEGFGMPVLEAMAHGVPVVASNAAAIPEVVGNAGLLADVRNPSAFADALGAVLSDRDVRDKLRRKGVERVKEFSWERCAREMLAVYSEVG